MPENKHPVIEEIERRSRGDSPQLKLALAVEGGGIRCAVTAGEICALASSGIDPLIFDAHFGSSGGSYVAAYYLSGRINAGTTMFYEQNNGGEFIDLKQLILRRRPVLKLDHVLDTVMDNRIPIDFNKIIQAERLYVLATKLPSLTRHIFKPATSVNELKSHLRAGATIPAVAGNPVEIDGEEYIDAAITEPMPYQAAIDMGYDAVLLLSSRPNNAIELAKRDFFRKMSHLIIAKRIKSINPGILDLMRERVESDAIRLTELKEKTDRPTGAPFVYSVHPSSEYAIVKQMEKKPDRIIAGTKSGYLALKQAFGVPEPIGFNTESNFYGTY